MDVPSLRHEPIDLDPLSTRLLRLCDGTRSHTALMELLMEDVETGRLELEATAPTEPHLLALHLSSLVRERLDRLTRSALLLA